mmetsp:Transcript_71543/g.198587  ORF Transcript_71543/g.198587 Transcript_71543/m.198587 type:complete len:377 (+) Transcript_71543:38-1168(+)
MSPLWGCSPRIWGSLAKADVAPTASPTPASVMSMTSHTLASLKAIMSPRSVAPEDVASPTPAPLKAISSPTSGMSWGACPDFNTPGSFKAMTCPMSVSSKSPSPASGARTSAPFAFASFVAPLVMLFARFARPKAGNFIVRLCGSSEPFSAVRRLFILSAPFALILSIFPVSLSILAVILSAPLTMDLPNFLPNLWRLAAAAFCDLPKASVSPVAALAEALSVAASGAASSRRSMSIRPPSFLVSRLACKLESCREPKLISSTARRSVSSLALRSASIRARRSVSSSLLRSASSFAWRSAASLALRSASSFAWRSAASLALRSASFLAWRSASSRSFRSAASFAWRSASSFAWRSASSFALRSASSCAFRAASSFA